MPTLPDLTAYGAGGLTLIVACYVVLQALKRSRRRLAAHMPLLVIALAAALVASLMWAPVVFRFLAGTIVTAALVIGSHGVMKNSARLEDPKR